MNKKDLICKLKQHKFSDKIIEAFKKVDREDFIPHELKKQAYEDIPLPIGYNQTISQPYTIAFMLNLLDLKDKQKILEVGSGSGYVLALLAELSRGSKIFGVERIKELAKSSKIRLANYKNAKVIYGNGVKGLEREAPFDRILVSAASNKIPQDLINQLKIEGIMVIPVGSSILRIKKKAEKLEIKEYPGFVFVPLIEE